MLSAHQYLRNLKEKNPKTLEAALPLRLILDSKLFHPSVMRVSQLPQPFFAGGPSTVSASGPSPNSIGLYCFLNLIFCGTSGSFQLVVLLKCEAKINIRCHAASSQAMMHFQSAGQWNCSISASRWLIPECTDLPPKSARLILLS